MVYKPLIGILSHVLLYDWFLSESIVGKVFFNELELVFGHTVK